MFNLLFLWFGALARLFRSRRHLVLENLALRHRLTVLKRHLWGAKTSSTSRHHAFKPIFMMQSTENSLVSEPETRGDFVSSHQCRWQSFRRIGNPGSKAQMRTTSIVMNHPVVRQSSVQLWNQ
jgi:hypothetical protein